MAYLDSQPGFLGLACASFCELVKKLGDRAEYQTVKVDGQNIYALRCGDILFFSRS